MNSITYGVGYFLAILVVNVFSTDYTLLSAKKKKYNDQYINFGYGANKFLVMEITLKNISLSVTTVELVLYDYKNNKKGDSVLNSERVKGNIGKNTREVKFMILKDLTYDAILVTVELYNDQAICDTIIIAKGRSIKTMYWSKYTHEYIDPTTNSKTYYYRSDDCFAPKPCEIVTDLGNKCQEPPPSTDYSCIIEASQYINCTFIKQATYNRFFYQTYDNNSYIGPAPEIKKRTIKLLIKLELFDNKTTVNVASKTKVIWSSDRLNLTAKDIRQDYNVKELRYSETTDVQYSCKDYGSTVAEVRVSLINTDNKITTLKETTINRPFKMAESGTILCCLYYETISKNDQEVHISRVVENKTLLIYQSQESTNLTDSEAQTKSSLTDWLIYLVPSILGICVVTLAIYIIKQKRCCTNSHPAEETVELDDHATQNQVLYANLDFVRDEHQPQVQNEESHYANIVGVLHPLS